jgi:hypothetical protein
LPVYEDQPLFSDVESLLRDHSFSFYGFTTFHGRSGKRIDKRDHRVRERALYADAVFLKDPLSDARGLSLLSERQQQILWLVAALLGYADLAMELLERCDWAARERDALAATVRNLSRIDIKDEVRRSSLSPRPSAPARRATPRCTSGRFVDGRRTWSDVDDVVLG